MIKLIKNYYQGDIPMLIKTLIILIVVLVIVILLYNNGMLTFSNKKAYMFIGKNSLSKKCFSASFKGCTGYVKRVLIFRKSGEYTFKLESGVTSGEIKAVLKNSDKTDVFVLTPECDEIILNISEGKYYLSIEMYKAYGKYNFNWK